MARPTLLAAACLLAATTALPPPAAPSLPLVAPPPIYRHLASRHSAPTTLRYLVTGYCRCSACCGKTDGITASGHPARAERTVAVDPHYIPLGSRLHLRGLGERVAEDTGGNIRGRRLDVFFPTHREALAFGRQWLEVEILPGRPEHPAP